MKFNLAFTYKALKKKTLVCSLVFAISARMCIACVCIWSIVMDTDSSQGQQISGHGIRPTGIFSLGLPPLMSFGTARLSSCARMIPLYILDAAFSELENELVSVRTLVQTTWIVCFLLATVCDVLPLIINNHDVRLPANLLYKYLNKAAEFYINYVTRSAQPENSHQGEWSILHLLRLALLKSLRSPSQNAC